MCRGLIHDKDSKHVRTWRDTKLKGTTKYCSFTPYSLSVNLTKAL